MWLTKEVRKQNVNCVARDHFTGHRDCSFYEFDIIHLNVKTVHANKLEQWSTFLFIACNFSTMGCCLSISITGVIRRQSCFNIIVMQVSRSVLEKLVHFWWHLLFMLKMVLFVLERVLICCHLSLWLQGNVGDSRCIASINGEVQQLSFDHKPGNELESKRIVAAGGWVEFNRVNGRRWKKKVLC